MRILIACGDSFNETVPRHFLNVSAELVKRGHQVFLLVHGNSYSRSEVEINGIPILRWKTERPTGLRDALYLSRLISTHRPDALIASFGAVNLMMTVGWLLRVPARIAYYRTLSSQVRADTHHSKLLRLVLDRRKQFVYKASTHVFGNSGAAARDVAAVYNVPSHKVRIFHNSLDDPFAINPSLQTLRPEPNTVFVPGRFALSKGQDVVIRAIALLHEQFPEVRVRFAGVGADQPYRALAEELGVTDYLQFLGPVPHEEIFAEARRSWVTIVPSRSESFGNVVVEAMSVGTPVIASNVGGIPEHIHHEVDGILIPPDDPAALAAELASLLENPARRHSLGEAAREKFVKRYVAERMIPETVDRLEALLAHEKSRSAPVFTRPRQQARSVRAPRHTE